ncbi:MAG: D-serine ammonia-lyase [Oscillospiraceae bacterium]
MKEKYASIGAVADMMAARETYWNNDGLRPFAEVAGRQEMGPADIADAAARLQRFAPFIMRAFPETVPDGGLIESPLREIAATKEGMKALGPVPEGRLFLKMDSHLAVAGSVKARGGIYEVLKHTEDIALEEGILREGDDYAKLADYRDLFSRYTVQVGSTGNLGLSIGITSAAVGYRVVVHMSADAKQWKKDLLRSKGVEVKEYAGDYGKAVAEGRALSDADPKSYFVDDEHSKALFLGYSVAGQRLKEQLAAQGVTVDAAHPLFVYLPCGVGGAPGGIAFGLKQQFGDNVHCFFVEPVQCPCMMAGLATGEKENICVQDLGLTGLTEADGLAVGRPSGMVARMMEPLLSGCFTVADGRLFDALRVLHGRDGVFIEPSSCAALGAWQDMARFEGAREYVRRHGLEEKLPDAVHIAWATGGRLVPEEIRQAYLVKKL